MENKNIPYLVYESAQARSERTIKRLILALIIATVLIFASNLVWLYCWQQYDYTSEETKIDVKADRGNVNYIGNDGDITNGTDYGNETQEDEN